MAAKIGGKNKKTILYLNENGLHFLFYKIFTT